LGHIVILKLGNFVSILKNLVGIFITPTIPTKCCLHQILDEINVKGCENGLNIFKFTKDILVVKRPWKGK